MGMYKNTMVPLVGFIRCQADGRRLLSKSETMCWFARWGQHEFVWSLEIATPQPPPPHPVLPCLLPPARSAALPQRVSQLADLPTVRYSPPHIAQSAVLLPPATPITSPQLNLSLVVVEKSVDDLQSLRVIQIGERICA